MKDMLWLDNNLFRALFVLCFHLGESQVPYDEKGEFQRPLVYFSYLKQAVIDKSYN